MQILVPKWKMPVFPTYVDLSYSLFALMEE